MSSQVFATVTPLARPRLLRKLYATPNGQHVILTAPSGYGKTTLLRAFARGHPHTHYFPLTLADADLVYFQTRLQPLLAPQNTILLDDIHHLASAPEVWQWLARLLDAPQPRFILSGRAIPNEFAHTNLTRLTRISAADLAFTLDETCALLQLRGRALDAAAPWHARTAGWALALDLIARHSKGETVTAAPDAQNFLRDAANALFQALPRDLLEFMRVTAIPIRFDDELAARLVEISTDAARALRDEIQQRNLFLETLDAGWQRYHDLIRETLRDAARARALTPRIVAWFAARGDWEMAVEHALAAGLDALAAQTLLEMPPAFIWSSNRYRTFRRWVLALAPTTRAAHPELLARLGRDLHYIGQVAEGWNYLEAARRLLALQDERGGAREKLQAVQLTIATALRRDGNPERALEIYETILVEAALAPETKLRVLLGLGGALDSISRFHAARAICRQGIVLAESVGDAPHAFHLRINLATVLVSLGSFDAADAALAANETFCADRAGLRVTNLAYQAEVDFERGAWGALAEHLQAAETLLTQTEDAGHMAIWLQFVRALYHTGRGEFAAAQKILDAAAPYSYEQELYRALYQVWLWRRQKEFPKALALADSFLAQPLKNLRVRAQFALGRALAAWDMDSPSIEFPDALALIPQLRLRADMVRLRAHLALQCERVGAARWRHHARAVLRETSRAEYAALLTLRDPDLGVAFWTLCVQHSIESGRALHALKQMRAPLEPLIKLLTHQNAAVRVRAADALRFLERDDALPALNAALENERAEHARRAIERARDLLETVPPPPLDVQLLGEFRVRRAGVPIAADAWHRPIAQRLFQFFALHRGEPLARDQILEALWNDADPRSAAGTFRTVFSRVRNTLEPHLRPKAPSRYFAAEGDVYRFDPFDRVRVDAEQFTATIRRALNDAAQHDIPPLSDELIAALTNYQPLLPHLPLEEWLLEPRERLNALYVEGCLYVAQAQLIYQRWNDALNWAHKTIQAAPWAEEAYQVLMRAHARMDNRSLALKAYADAVSALHRELDLTPSPLTEWLAQQLRAGQEI